MTAWAVPVLASAMAVGGLVLGWFAFAHRATTVTSVATDPRALPLFSATAQGGSLAALQRPVGAGDQFFAPRTAPVKIGDAGGTELTLEPGAMLTVLEASTTRRFALRRGAVGARVRKLVPGQRFIIETADAEIEVHGTQFRVVLGEPEELPCSGAGPRDAIATRVTVTEGVVSVKWAGDEQRLKPGDEWPPRCAPARASAPQAAAAPSSPYSAGSKVAAPASPSSRSRVATSLHRTSPAAGARRTASRAAALDAATASSRDTPASALEAQNDLFVAAVRARRAGHSALALSLFNRFIQEYPGASLLESALAQKMRLLAASADRSSAPAAARQYLDRFPDGFAHDEAQTLIGATDRR